jgi:mRNA-degrading endonuclease RelE of RelBE toxin-antitoxin system
MTALDAMQTDPLSGDVVRLTGQDAFRRRVGDYRIIFRIDGKARAVGIVDRADNDDLPLARRRAENVGPI